MGAAFTSQQSSAIQSINNNILNASTSNCSATCSAYNGGNTVIINGTTINGNVSFNQSCDLVATCTINSQVNTNVTDIISSMQKQTSVTANGFPDFSLDGVSQSVQVQQNITTSVANIIESSCQSSTQLVNQDNFTYLNNSTVNGSLTFSQTGTVNSNCTLNNISSITVANKETASQSQTSVITSSILLFIILIVVVVVIIAIIFLLNFLFKKGKSSGGSSNSGNSSNLDTNALANQFLNSGSANGAASTEASAAATSGSALAAESSLVAEAAELAPLAVV